MKYTPPAEPSRNGHTSRLPSDFAQAARLMTRRPLPAKPVASQVPTDIPVPAREDRYLSDAHIAELEASGIPAEYALDSGAYTEDDPEALAKLLNWERVPASRGTGLVLLSHDADGNMAIRFRAAWRRASTSSSGHLGRRVSNKLSATASSIPAVRALRLSTSA